MEVTSLFQDFAFPVACVIALGLFIVMMYKDNIKREEKLYDMLYKYGEQMDKLEEANQQFAVITGKLRDDVNSIKEVLEGFKDE
jgi:hypothetical protein